MASAQVLPNSVGSNRKKADLEAGKRKLEEFRKKRAKGRDKKAASTGQLLLPDVNQFDPLPQATQQMKILDSNNYLRGIAAESLTKTGPGLPYGSEAIMSSQHSEMGLLNGEQPLSYGDSIEKPGGDQEPKWHDSSSYPGQVYTYSDYWRSEENDAQSIYTGTEGETTYGFSPAQPTDIVPLTTEIDQNVDRSNFHSSDYFQVEGNGNSSKEYSFKDSNISGVSGRSSLLNTSTIVPPRNKVEFSGTTTSYNSPIFPDGATHSSSNFTEATLGAEQYMHYNADLDDAKVFDKGVKKLNDYKNHQISGDSVPWWTSESASAGSSSEFGSSYNQIPLNSTISETGIHRTRPSFLDSLNVPRVTSQSHLPFTESVRAEPFISFKSSTAHSSEKLVASQLSFTEPDIIEPFMKFRNPDAPTADDQPVLNTSYSVNYEGDSMSQDMKDDSLLRQHEFSFHRKSEDFSTLEQHIEDLTQEKFSLQRALEASQTVAEALATENSSLTDSFNQQGAVVNQLKSDLERLQEEIRAQMLALDAVKMEYTNAQLECSAADERAKILASEVIGLEEKALRLRSNELKLERQLENSNAEISSYKKKLSTLERERKDLQSTIDALLEEKKLLQSKLRKASANGKAVDVSKNTTSKDVSTSTEDLGYELNQVDSETSATGALPSIVPDDVQEIQSAFTSSSSIPGPPLLSHENRHLHLPDASGPIPPDQLRMIGNINSLISELALEKEELTRALSVESSNSSKLKDLNKELSQKLEAQTQRLELLIAQSMAHESVPVRPADSPSIHDGAEYADEGDEVVERVLGWIMKLFPGGPSKRRTSKLL